MTDDAAGDSTRSLRLLSVLHYNGVYGGPQNRNARLTPLLRERGVETLLLLPNEPGPAAGVLRERGVEVLQQPLHRLRATLNPLVHLRFLARFVFEVRAIRRLIRERGIDVVLINGSVNPHGAVAARLAGVPVIWQLLDTRPPAWMLWGVMRLIRVLADVVMTTGMAVARMHPGAESFGDRLVCFFPPVDTAVFRPDSDARQQARRRLGVPDTALLVGTVGNLTAQKGHEYFLAALGRLMPERPELHARLLGQRVATHDDYAAGLEQQATDTGLLAHGRFAFVTPEASVDAYLPAFDVFVLSSVPRSEGIPTSVLEAMACGVPVVAADVGAVREAVENGVTGYVVPPCDVDALTEAVSALLGDAVLRQRMGEAGRAKAVREFDAATCADAHRLAIDRALAQRRLANAAG